MPPIAEEKNMATQGFALQPIAHQPEQAFESFAHVGSSHRQIDSRRGTEAEHGLHLL